MHVYLHIFHREDHSLNRHTCADGPIPAINSGKFDQLYKFEFLNFFIQYNNVREGFRPTARVHFPPGERVCLSPLPLSNPS